MRKAPSARSNRSGAGVGLWTESLDQEPEGQCELEQEPGHGEVQADLDAEEFGDGSQNVARVSDQARHGDPAGNQAGPEEDHAEDGGADAECHLSDLVGRAVQFDQDASESRRPGVGRHLAQRHEHENRQHADAEEHDLDDHGREVGEGGALAVPFEDGEEQHRFRDVHRRVQQHQERSECEKQPERGDRAQEVGRGDEG